MFKITKMHRGWHVVIRVLPCQLTDFYELNELLSIAGATSTALAKTSTTAALARTLHVSFTGTSLLHAT